MPGAFNNIIFLDQSHLFNDRVAARSPPASYAINAHPYEMGYYFAHGIYPKWATIVETIYQPQTLKRQ